MRGSDEKVAAPVRSESRAPPRPPPRPQLIRGVPVATATIRPERTVKMCGQSSNKTSPPTTGGEIAVKFADRSGVGACSPTALPAKSAA
jgi:hypothetical protein